MAFELFCIKYEVFLKDFAPSKSNNKYNSMTLRNVSWSAADCKEFSIQALNLNLRFRRRTINFYYSLKENKKAASFFYCKAGLTAAIVNYRTDLTKLISIIKFIVVAVHRELNINKEMKLVQLSVF